MNPVRNAVRAGLRRGLVAFRISLQNPEDLSYYVLAGGGAVLYLFLNRHELVPGTGLSVPQVAIPSILALAIFVGGVIGPAFTIINDRDDGSLLRLRATPHGLRGYVVADLLFEVLGALPMFVLVLVPTAFFAPPLMHRGPDGWLWVLLLFALGMVVTLPLGMMIGSVLRKPSQVSTWGLSAVGLLASVSGIFTPLTALWGWVQVIAQVFPLYWLGHGLRWAFLPDAARAVELGGQWRIVEAVLVLAGWAIVGLVLAPKLLARMARGESGSEVARRTEEKLQRAG